MYIEFTLNITGDYQEHNGRIAECIHANRIIKYLITGIKFGYFYI